MLSKRFALTGNDSDQETFVHFCSSISSVRRGLRCYSANVESIACPLTSTSAFSLAVRYASVHQATSVLGLSSVTGPSLRWSRAVASEDEVVNLSTLRSCR